MSVDQVIATALLAAAELAFLVSAAHRLTPLAIKLAAAGLFLAVMPVLLVVAGAISAKGL